MQLTDLLTADGRRARSRYLGESGGLGGADLEAFCDRMELSWRRQVLRDELAMDEQEAALDDTHRGLRRRIDAVIAALDAQLHPAAVAA